MEVVPYKAEHLMALQIQRGQEFVRQYVTEAYAKVLEDEFAFTAMVEGKPIAVGGVKELWPGRGLCWTFIDKSAGAHFVAIHKAVQRMLDLVPYKRVEAEVACGFKQGHRWMKMLGFQLEAACMRAHRVDGGDDALYARVR